MARKYFGTDGIRGRANNKITADVALKVGQAAGGRVLVIAGVRAGLDRRRHDVRRSREVRLPGTEADDVLAGGHEGLGLGVDGESG